MRLDRRTLLGAVPLAGLAARAGAVAGPTLGFVAVGDWGRDGAAHQRDVAAAMGAAAASSGSAFTISTGDNFYENGVRSAADPQWRTSFEEVYTHPALQSRWYAVLGNHDYRGVPQAELDYAATSRRWFMPARYYTASPAPFVDFFFLDTSPLVHSYRAKVHSAIAANVASQDVAAQLAWLDAALAKSTAAWKIVVGHHTIRSGGSEHGDTPEMVELVLPILQKHRVPVYLNGHEHDLQHIARDGLDYICSGAGSEVRPTGPTTGTKFALARSGFAVIRPRPGGARPRLPRLYRGERLPGDDRATRLTSGRRGKAAPLNGFGRARPPARRPDWARVGSWRTNAKAVPPPATRRPQSPPKMLPSSPPTAAPPIAVPTLPPPRPPPSLRGR